MTQANSTPPVKTNIPLQTLSLIKQIVDRPQNPDMPRGSATLAYTATEIRGSFTFPLERVAHPDGELLRVIDFLG